MECRRTDDFRWALFAAKPSPSPLFSKLVHDNLRQLPHCRAEFALFVRDREDVGAHAANTMINLRFAVPRTFPCNRPRTHDRLRRPWRWLRGGRQGWVISGRRGWGISGLLCGHWGL